MSDLLMLRNASHKGPIAVVNISRYRSDALIIAYSTLDRPQIVPLSHSLDKWTLDWSESLHRGAWERENGRMPESHFDKRVLKPILRGLWRHIVDPVSRALSSLAPYARRVWWCPTGRLTFLPLHMAAERDEEPPFMSSYTTTVSSLLRAQTSSRKSDDVRLLAVSCADVPGYPALPGTSEELKSLQELLPEGGIACLREAGATIDSVLSGITDHAWMHLACHGTQMQDDPYRSHFVLSDGRLSMSDIVARNLPNAEFAFLSACETASGISALSDEAMHLAASLSFIGFRGIVATMWAVDDDTGPSAHP